MTSRLPLALPVSVFRDDEPVIQSHPVLEGACPPIFGNTGYWDLNGIVRKAPNLAAAGFRVILRELDPQWNLLAREMAMIWFNPRHPAVLARGLHLPPDPVAPHTVSQRFGHLRALHAYGVSRQLPPWVGDWSDDDFKTYIEHRCQQGEAANAAGHVHVIKTLHRFRGTLANSGLTRDPWPDTSTNAVVDHPTVPELKTPAIRRRHGSRSSTLHGRTSTTSVPTSCAHSTNGTVSRPKPARCPRPRRTPASAPGSPIPATWSPCPSSRETGGELAAADLPGRVRVPQDGLLHQAEPRWPRPPGHRRTARCRGPHPHQSDRRTARGDQAGRQPRPLARQSPAPRTRGRAALLTENTALREQIAQNAQPSSPRSTEHTPHASESVSESAWDRRADMARCRDQPPSWHRRATRRAPVEAPPEGEGTG